MTDRASRADTFSQYKRVRRGDVVINRMRAFESGAGISRYDGMVSTDYAVLRTGGQLNAAFLHHLIRSRWFVGEMTARLRGIGSADLGNVRTPRINVEDLGDIRVALPPLHEQIAIADYLDAETARIDGIIEARVRELGLLDLRLIAAVREVVGADSLPDVPVRRVFRIVNGSTPPSDVGAYWDGDVTWVTPQDLSSARGEVRESARQISYAGYSACGATLVPPGSLLVSTRAPIGSVAIAGVELCTNQGCRALVPVTRIDPWFYYFVFVAARPDLESLGNGSTFRELSTDEFAAYRIPFPALDVQLRDAAVLRRIFSSTQRLAAAQRRQVELLRARRQAVISAAVTGQLAIPGVAA